MMTDGPFTYDQARTYYPQRDYDEGNRALIRRAYEQWQTGRYDAIEFKCFNKEEADEVEAFAEQHYPDMVLRVSWMVPRGLRDDD